MLATRLRERVQDSFISSLQDQPARLDRRSFLGVKMVLE